ncbi:tRNA lysidine(34) synthetase TilS [Anaerorudis cellulosivorans]|uniref:tRNA lysidine(34) synthetase TilS n=1 Tax=Anaerorudis cellulosivorans TaxID=3397862 RepID=UPI00221FB57F|nr:tRNA lysidine(34) synthetase TilS [Seramator thermalis]MCW1734834.1 tRNA lysidine(34) synthetase TilS [Seramator thermalis]
MIEKVRSYIQENRLLAPEDRVIVGFSGGMDSVTLLDVLLSLGYSCVAAHCNFHLRGEESERDAAFVKRWCEHVGVELVSVDFDTRRYATTHKISIEMAARELRYTWFEDIRKEHHAQAVAVAHHRDDLVETVLLNLIRGTGIRGLTGIPPKNNFIVRPLLGVSRDEIEVYVEERKLPFIFDSSNSDDVFVRNFLRLNVMPLLEKINPSVKNAIYRTAQHVGEAKKIYDFYVETQKKAIFVDNRIDIDKLKATLSPAAMLFEILSPLGFNASVIEDICRRLDSIPGNVFYSNDYRLIKDRNKLILDKNTDKKPQQEEYLIDKVSQEITDPIRLKINFLSGDIVINKDARFLYADADKLSFPLTLRKWQSGDWFVPFGMKGRKKLSDFFTDRKFSLVDKENAWVLTSGENMVWIVGERSDERFKVTEFTENVMVVEFIKD